MIRKSLALALGGLALVALGGCAAVDAVLSPSPTSTAQASIENIVAASEGVYTATDKGLQTAVTSHKITLALAQSLGSTDNKVYAALVALRSGVQKGQDVTALYNTYVALSTQFYGDARAAGISVAVPAPAPASSSTSTGAST